MGDFAMMTHEGTFIVNGTERVVVSQLVRSPGVYFTAAEDPNPGPKLFRAQLIPNPGPRPGIAPSAQARRTAQLDRRRQGPWARPSQHPGRRGRAIPAPPGAGASQLHLCHRQLPQQQDPKADL